MRTSLLLVPALLVGCGRKPVEAPESLSELARFLTANFADADLAELDAGMLALERELEAIGFEGDRQSRAVSPLPLQAADLGGMPEHDGFDPDEQVPVALIGRSEFDFDAQMRIVAESNHVCIESATTKYYGRTFTSDLDCFLDGACEMLTTENEVRKESLLANIWYDMNKDFRRFELEDGRVVMLARSWIPAPYPTDGGNGSWDQTYVLEAWIPDGARTQRFYAMWSSVSLAVLGDAAWAGLVENGIEEGYSYGDDYLNDFAGGLCREDRNRAHDR